jgi:hypothetical protein
MKFGFVFLAFSLFFLASSHQLFAQNKFDKPFIAPSDASGEDASSVIDSIRSLSVRSGERLFVVARRGDRESNDISFLRLAEAKTFIIKIKGFPVETTIFTVGERIQGEGGIEFYLGSQLKLVTLAKRNKMPNLTCCPDYFPPVKNKPQKRKSNKQ